MAICSKLTLHDFGVNFSTHGIDTAAMEWTLRAVFQHCPVIEDFRVKVGTAYVRSVDHVTGAWQFARRGTV